MVNQGLFCFYRRLHFEITDKYLPAPYKTKYSIILLGGFPKRPSKIINTSACVKTNIHSKAHQIFESQL